MPSAIVSASVGPIPFAKRLGIPLVVGVAALVFLQACSEEVTCPDSVNPSLHVAVVDSATMEPLASKATLSVGISTGFDANIGASPRERSAYVVYGDLGTYSLVVRAEGYKDWQRGGITVIKSALKCGGVNTVQITAKMQKA